MCRSPVCTIIYHIAWWASEFQSWAEGPSIISRDCDYQGSCKTTADKFEIIMDKMDKVNAEFPTYFDKGRYGRCMFWPWTRSKNVWIS